MLGAAVLLVGLYGLAGWLGAPWLAERLLARLEAQGSERVARIEAVAFNPFTLEAELEGFELSDGAAGAAFNAAAMRLNFSARSFLERRLVLTVAAIERPRTELRSLDQLSSEARRIRYGWLEHLRIEQLSIENGALAAGRNGPGSLTLEGIALRLTDFDGRADETAATAGDFRLEASTAAGTTLELEGSLAADLERAHGRLALGGLELASLARRLGGILSDVELRGRFDLAGDFVLTTPFATPRLTIDEAAIELASLALVPASGFDVAADGAAATGSLALTLASGDILTRGRIEIGSARVTLGDARVTPPRTLTLADAGAVISADAGGDGLSVNLGGTIDDAGDALLMARIPADPAAERRFAFEAADLPAALLSAYATQALGRGLTAGRADLSLEYAVRGERVDGSLGFAARDLQLAPRATPRAAAAPPGDDADGAIAATAAADDASLELAAALLETADGVIELDLPFAGNSRSVRFAAADALRARVAALTSTPFAELAPVMAGDTGAVRAVPFLPGDAALGDWALAAIEQLAGVLNARPRLGLRVRGGYDPIADRDALARQQIQLHVLLATAGPSAQARPEPVDFGSPRAQDVLDEFAGERLPAERIAEIANRFDCAGNLAVLCRRAYYASIFDALVDNESITSTALSRLGRFRAQSVADALRERGIAAERIEVASNAETIDTPYGVGLPIELAVADSRP